jgi:CDP-6-deoxy-D-xylo-4-hexulose-3-dehydrase
MFAHTLGNPVKFHVIPPIPIIEDCCEAVGSKGVGHIGTLATWSFYPAHQMTALGGGGMVTTNNQTLYQRMKSLRDWGKQYTWDSGRGGNQTQYDSEIGYHAGYTYTSIGWNFKLPEACAAFGRVQLKRLDGFVKRRRENWWDLYDRLKNIEEIYIPKMSAEASPFGFCMNVKGDRNKFGIYLESHGIKHRPFFAGNILRQPAFKSEDAWRFRTSDYLMEHSLFIGCWPSMTQEELDYIVEKIHEYFS